ncbi:MAG: aldolase [Gammaproteobacteria bacterium CG11_big_fil_rev_8_21_14_0_20_46_22]|nr:MAG: aldolase [Gammaproteobacteria bacterium CG12_big_fil_rev_8_21_14_0_65_46_12]PIR11963.1 MAG: aldolase [Gammaproteobacteria bacterium CG11_big_fil_rev_8_21_14_0_20_46_22]
MSANEQSLRETLAASHHIIHFNGCDDLLATHLSARIPNTDHMLISPHNVPFEEVCASRLVKTDLDGNILSNNGQTVMPQAHNIHASIYKAKQTILSAMHTHSIYGTAVASLREGLLPLNQHALRFYNDVAYHDLDGLALGDEGEHIVSSLGDKKVMILCNHGLLTTGQSIEEATYLMYYLERVCKMQIKTLSANAEIHPISQAVCEKTKAQFDSILSVSIDFDALRRRIEGLSRVNYKD